MMEAFVYFFDRLPVGLDEIEDAIECELDGRGEVTGSGSGFTGSNLDIEIDEGRIASDEALLIVLRRAFGNLELRLKYKIVVDGREYSEGSTQT